MLEPLSEIQQQWVDQTVGTLSTEEKVAQLLISNVGAYDDPDVMAAARDIGMLGGIFVGAADKEKHREALGALQARCRIPMVVTADLEAGAGHVVYGAVPFPEPLAVAAANDTNLAYILGQATAREGRHAGIHWTFAPVVDVNVHPDNPIANTRSLGDDPERVGRLAEAIVRGMQTHGIAACAKHFPGDGIDDHDQHVATTVNALTREEWHHISGLTFRQAIAAGVWSIMIGHIALPAWDDERDTRGVYRPASINRELVTALLRGELGFEGLNRHG